MGCGGSKEQEPEEPGKISKTPQKQYTPNNKRLKRKRSKRTAVKSEAKGKNPNAVSLK
jgi:hypothetical protein